MNIDNILNIIVSALTAASLVGAAAAYLIRGITLRQLQEHNNDKDAHQRIIGGTMHNHDTNLVAHHGIIQNHNADPNCHAAAFRECLEHEKHEMERIMERLDELKSDVAFIKGLLKSNSSGGNTR